MLIKVLGNYEIYVDGNKDHLAREFIKIYVNPKTQEEIPQYRSIGHYSNVKGACEGIYKDLCIQKGSKKDAITLKQWVDIQKEALDEINKAMEKLEV